MMNWYKKAQEEYKGEHQAPNRESGAPLYDLTKIYPEDIYSSHALQHYGQGNPLDSFCISIIKSARNRPNYPITIYRAIPKITSKVNSKIKELSKLISYFNAYKFFPVNNPIINKIGEKYPSEQYTGHKYDERSKLIYQDILKEIEQLAPHFEKPIKINKGDWVTINKEYAREHGEDNLRGNYKILSKNVKAKDIFTEGDSIQEWGYDPA
jgi:hypothetical protein